MVLESIDNQANSTMPDLEINIYRNHLHVCHKEKF